MTSAAEQAVKDATAQSDFLKTISTAQAKWIAAAEDKDSDQYRALAKEEIDALHKFGNASENWDHVKVRQNFKPQKIIGCYFSGTVRLGEFTEKVEIEKGVSLGSGIYNCDISNSIIEDHAHISGTNLLANYIISRSAVVLGCGRVVCSGETCFGNGNEIALGVETGGRETAVFAEITVPTAAEIAGDRSNLSRIKSYRNAVKVYSQSAKSNVGVIGEGAKVKNTPKLVDVFVGEFSVIDAATGVENSTILSSEKEQTFVESGSFVKDSILQWGVHVESLGIVERSVCCEYSHVGRHGKLIESVLGPNSGVQEGECLSSLCGPFVGFHHQSLLVAAFWPEGRGNVASGAQVGSNHTFRTPDQEIRAGEGTFFGLGVIVKFPSDFTNAPYSILAAGTDCLPQRVEFPFSLINKPAVGLPGVSPAFNEIMPAWVINDSIYTIRRNEGKYRQRNKAVRTQFNFEIFRPDIVDLMIEAHKRLKETFGEGFYTEKDIPGLGKNYLTEKKRLAGVNAYDFYIRYYALVGLWRRLEVLLEQNKPAKDVLGKKSDDARWEHERKILCEKFPGVGAGELLNELIRSQIKIARDTEESKRRDDNRGARIIDDYNQVHAVAEEDNFVMETWAEAERFKAELSKLSSRLKL